MRRLIRCILGLFVMLIMMNACSTSKLKLEDLKNCSQIFVLDSGILCLYIYDSWGEKNNFVLYNRNLEEIANSCFRVDPIPRIRKVESDTIILKYTLTSYLGQDSGKVSCVKPDLATSDRIGKYAIIWEYSFEAGGNARGEEIRYDSVSISKNFFLAFYNQGEKIIDKNIAEYDFSGRFISYRYVYNATSQANTLIYRDYFVPLNDSIQEKCYKLIYNTLKY